MLSPSHCYSAIYPGRIKPGHRIYTQLYYLYSATVRANVTWNIATSQALTLQAINSNSMGFDIAIVTRNKIFNKEGELTDIHYLLDRGFCTMVLNAKNHPEPVLTELEKALKLDLSFLLKPEFYNPQKFSDSDLREMGLDEEYIKSHKTETPSGFVKINGFLDKLNQLLLAIESNPHYESEMSYDRNWWHTYFDKDLQVDLKTIKAFLTELLDKEEAEFSFDFG